MRVSGLLALLKVIACIECLAPAGYVVNKADGKAYRLVYQAEQWDRAAAVCEQDGAKLAVPKTQEEFLFLQQLVRHMHYPSIVGTEYKLLAWLGVHNREDHKIWKNVDGENINDTGFHKWASGNGSGFSDNILEPHCVGIDAVNPGFRQFWCDRRQPFICQLKKETH